MEQTSESRRNFLKWTAMAGSGLTLAGVSVIDALAAEKEKEVEANEDLMREHGVLRRALLVYRNAAQRLRTNPSELPPDALLETAMLFRSFGEDYHERSLEEKYVFPHVRKLKGPASSYPDILHKQHDRGRQLTDYVIETARKGSIAGANAEQLARSLDAFVLMYEHHAAREDTVVFPAWKNTLSNHAYKEMSEQFEFLEKRMFGKDGYEHAVQRIAAIESRLGLADISQFTISVK